MWWSSEYLKKTTTDKQGRGAPTVKPKQYKPTLEKSGLNHLHTLELISVTTVDANEADHDLFRKNFRDVAVIRSNLSAH